MNNLAREIQILADKLIAPSEEVAKLYIQAEVDKVYYEGMWNAISAIGVISTIGIGSCLVAIAVGFSVWLSERK